METDTELFQRLVIFAVATLLNAAYSWKPLHNPRVHGFYRFFVFEGVIALLLLRRSMGLTVTHEWLHWPAMSLNLLSIALVISGYFQLRRSGKIGARESYKENKSFENTTQLVTCGIYQFIRHPMYSSLLAYAWGVYLGNPTIMATVIVGVITILAFLTAKVEERENIAYFGKEYLEYMKRTRMFIPYVI